jgi:hypothetical protein
VGCRTRPRGTAPRSASGRCSDSACRPLRPGCSSSGGARLHPPTQQSSNDLAPAGGGRQGLRYHIESVVPHCPFPRLPSRSKRPHVVPAGATRARALTIPPQVVEKSDVRTQPSKVSRCEGRNTSVDSETKVPDVGKKLKGPAGCVFFRDLPSAGNRCALRDIFLIRKGSACRSLTPVDALPAQLEVGSTRTSERLWPPLVSIVRAQAVSRRGARRYRCALDSQARDQARDRDRSVR